VVFMYVGSVGKSMNDVNYDVLCSCYILMFSAVQVGKSLFAVAIYSFFVLTSYAILLFSPLPASLRV